MENKSEILNDSCIDLVAIDTTSATHPSQPNDRVVPFCCAANLPGNFNLAVSKDPRILYDLSNLSCKIEPRCPRGSSCSRSFDITVVGSIPFIANATVAVGTNCSNASTSPNCPIKISCGCVAPVRNTVCNVCSYEEAIKACALLELKLRSCTCVDVTVTASQGNHTNNKCVVTFTGNFTLPNCTTPINVTCPRA